ncbi:MAG: TIGR04282 family arsenosugar biosynthesis glycosyltransferase [Treponema sp.]|nr:TIGR04282 family arsenosugar biosynthesis glycosyltransferase [Treponema sp.]
MAQNVEKNAIILFTRIPVPGKTKTRLQPFLTAGECCLLHHAFIRDIHQVLRETKTACDIIVCYTPEGDLADMETLLPAACAFLPQRGLDIGQRMHNAMCSVLEKGYSRCLLVGSDLPLLRSEALDEAFCLLENRDIVLCPTEDGGYYLIGMKEPCEEVFHLLEYGVSTVFGKTLAAAAQCGKTCAAGAGTMDVDDCEDLLRLKERLESEEASVCPETRTVLAELFRKGRTP